MAVAYNEETGKALRLDQAGEWVPTETRENPETGEVIALDGAEWKSVKSKPAPPDRGILGSINNIVGGVADAAAQGASFGFADELGAGVRAYFPKALRSYLGVPDGAVPALEPDKRGGDNYDRALTDIRARDKQFAEEHPVASAAGNIAGGLLGARPLMGPRAAPPGPPVPGTPRQVIAGPVALGQEIVPAAVPPLAAGITNPTLQAIARSATSTTPRQIASMAGLGAASGALGGFGAGEGGFENRLSGAGFGAAIGAGAGVAVPLGGALTSKIGGIAGNLMGVRNNRNVALDHLSRALERDKADPAALAQALPPQGAGLGSSQTLPTSSSTRTRPPDKPLAIVDVGTNTQRLGRTVEVIPGAGSARAHEFLDDRQLGQQDRVAMDINKHLGSDTFYQNLEQLDRKRRIDAAPLYERAYAQPFVWNRTLETLLDRPSTRSALGRAYRIAEEESVDPRGLGLDIDPDGNVKIIPTAANMKTLDYVKRGLDDVLEARRDPVTGKLNLDEEGRAIQITRERFRDTIDAMNPVYAQARAAWGGPSQTMDAMHLGRRYARGDDEVVIQRFRELSPGDQDAFRIGVSRELVGKVENTTDMRDSVSRVFGSPAQRARLQALFPDRASFNQFSSAMDAEKRMMQSRRAVTGNSVTGRIAAEQEDAGALTNSLTDYASGGLRGVISGAATRAIGRARGLGEKGSEELASMLYTSNKAEQARIIAELRKRRAEMDERTVRAVQAAVVNSMGTANLLGQAFAPDERRRNQ